MSIAMAPSGYVVVVGVTFSRDFPTTPGAFDTYFTGGTDSTGITKLPDTFVAGVGPDGSLLFSTFLGGSGEDSPSALALDPEGNIYVTGETTSRDFPTTVGAFDTTLNGVPVYAGSDAFVAKLNPTASSLIYSTYLGGTVFNPFRSGTNIDHARSIVVDAYGSAYVTGVTNSTDFPSTANAFDATYNGGYDAFVVGLNPNGTELVYSTYLGGRNSDGGSSVAIDGTGKVYVAGRTNSQDFPTTVGAFSREHRGGDDGFVVSFIPGEPSLSYATLFGGRGDDHPVSVAVDGGSVYVAGGTNSSDFPTTPGAFDTSWEVSDWSEEDAFVTMLSADGSGLIYSTYLGGGQPSGYRQGDIIHSLFLDSRGRAYVAGQTGSICFPTTPGAWDTSYDGGWGTYNAFVAELGPAGATLLYSTLLGRDRAYGVALDSLGEVYVAGGELDGFVARVKMTMSGTPRPMLSCAGGPDFSSGAVHPGGGFPGDSFTYRVRYTDPMNRPPAAGYPKLHLRFQGEPIPGSPFALAPLDPADEKYSDGRVYTMTLRLNDTGFGYTYHFSASTEASDYWPSQPEEGPYVLTPSRQAPPPWLIPTVLLVALAYLAYVGYRRPKRPPSSPRPPQL